MNVHIDIDMEECYLRYDTMTWLYESDEAYSNLEEEFRQYFEDHIEPMHI